MYDSDKPTQWFIFLSWIKIEIYKKKQEQITVSQKLWFSFRMHDIYLFTWQ